MRKSVAKTPKPRKKKSARTKLDEEALRLWSLAVRKRDKLCQHCGKRPSTNAHHIISRARHGHRYDVGNGIGLCNGCHLFIAHKYPEQFRCFLVQWMGADSYDWLFRSAMTPSKKLTENDLKLQILYLKGILNEPPS